MHYAMGGLWVDDKQMSNIEGLFAAGECEYQYHGANRLGANSLMSCIYGGLLAGPQAHECAQGLDKGAESVNPAFFADEVRRQQELNDEVLKSEGKESPHELQRELGEAMTENCTVIRHNDKLAATDEKLKELKGRAKKLGIRDRGNWANEELLFARQLNHMFDLARVMVQGAFRRNESRGAHYKPEFPERDDSNWLKTTKAKFKEEGPEFSYEAVDVQYIKPRRRSYDD